MRKNILEKYTINKPDSQNQLSKEKDEKVCVKEELLKIFQDIEKGKFISENWGNIKLELQEEVFQKCLAHDTLLAEEIIKNYENFNNSIASLIIKSELDYYIIRCPKKFPDLEFDEKLANKLIENGHSNAVVEKINIFHNVKLDEKLVNKILKNKSCYRKSIYVIAYNLVPCIENKFENLSNDIAYELINEGFAEKVFANLDKFPDIKFDENLVNKLIEKGSTGIGTFLGGKAGANGVYNYRLILDTFPNLKFDEDLANKLIENNSTDVIFSKFCNFNQLSNNSANKLIEFGELQRVIKHNENFQNLNLIKIY